LRGFISPNIAFPCARYQHALVSYGNFESRAKCNRHPRPRLKIAIVNRDNAILNRVAAKIQTAVLLAAGRGKRLGALTAEMPKPLLDIAGAPVISHIVDALECAGIRHFILVTGYCCAQIEDWAKSHTAQNPSLQIETVRQAELNGTGGAMLAAAPLLDVAEKFIFGWGDILMDLGNYPRFVHRANAEDYDLLLAVNRVKDPFRGAAVYLSKSMRVERLDEKPAEGTAKTEWNNAGLFATDRRIFDYLAALQPSERGELELPEAISRMIDDGREVCAIDIRGFWSDIGTAQDVQAARSWFKPKGRRHPASS
jgi:glucose-1-phosphate thymidylyltransferase